MRTRVRSLSSALAVNINDVVELIDRLEAQNERWITMLLESHRRKQGGLQAMRATLGYDAAEAAQRRAGGRRFGVVRKSVEVALHGQRRAEPADQPPLARGKGRGRRGTDCSALTAQAGGGRPTPA